MPKVLRRLLAYSSSSVERASSLSSQLVAAGQQPIKASPSSSHGECEQNQILSKQTHPSLEKLYDPSFSSDVASYSALLRSCSKGKSLHDGFCIHGHIIRIGLEGNLYIQNHIMDMYGRCDGSITHACALFEKMPYPDIFSWNFIIRAYTHHGLYDEALQLLQKMVCQGLVLPDEYIYVSVLSVHASIKASCGGKCLHIQILSCGLQSEIIVATALLNMYAKCGNFGDAWKVFQSISERDIVCWNTMLGACVVCDNTNNAIHLYNQLHEEGAVPNKATIHTMIDACIVCGAAQSLGKHIHACILTTDLGSDIVIRLAVANMYSKCVSMRDVIDDVSSSLIRGDVVSESTLFTIYAQKGLVNDALDAFKQMQHKSILPDRYAFASMISACSSQGAFHEGEKMHAYVAGTMLETDLVAGTALINMYGKCRKVWLARSLFDKMHIHDVISWTAMIGAYAQSDEGGNAFELFKQMKQKGLKPNKVTFATLFDACTSKELLTGCKDVHRDIIGGKVELDPYVGTALINMYGRFECLEDAKTMFEKMPIHDEIMWNAMITASAHNGEGKIALKMFRDMQEQGMIPNKVTFVSTCDACAIDLSLSEGKQLHTRILVTRLEPDVVLATAFINMYGRCGCLDDAKLIFDLIPKKDVVSWTAIMTVYAHNGETKKAFKLFDEMLVEGLEPDKVCCISILSACVSKTGIDDGRLMHMRAVACALDSDIGVMNGLIVMYGKCGSMKDAIRIFENICDNSRETYVSILSACSNQVDLAEGRRIHELIMKTGFDIEVSVGNALINMYSKCGTLQESGSVFEIMPDWDVVSWTIMITSHAQHGHGEFALHLFDKMQKEGLLPNKVTFVNILNAFSHAGMVDEGFQCFGYLNHGVSSMSPIEDHYNCIVDLLGRAGRLSEAEDLIKKMPLTPSVISWTSFLNACRQHLDVERGEYAAEILFRMEPTNPAPYLTMYNLYIAAGRLQDAAKVMCKLRENHLLKCEVLECMTLTS